MEPEIALFDVGLDAEIPQDRGQDDFQLEHGVFATHAGTRPGGERYEGVVMTIGGLLGQEVVGVEDIRVRVKVRLPVHLEGRHYDCRAGRYYVISRY